MDAIRYGMNSLRPYENDIVLPDDTKQFQGGFY